MKIYITGLPSGYDVEHLVRLFYPMAPLTLTPPEDGEGLRLGQPGRGWPVGAGAGKGQKQNPHRPGARRGYPRVCPGQPDL